MLKVAQMVAGGGWSSLSKNDYWLMWTHNGIFHFLESFPNQTYETKLLITFVFQKWISKS